MFHHGTFAAAIRTGTHALHLTQRCVLYGTDLTAAVTGGAGNAGRTRRRAAAVTGGAFVSARDHHFFFRTESSFFKRNGNAFLNIGSALRTIGIAAPTAASAEKGLKNIAETTHAAEIIKTAAVTAGAAHIAVHAGMAELIVAGAFIRIRQNARRFVHFFEFFSRFGIIGMKVGMIFFRHFFIGFFDFIIGSPF